MGANRCCGASGAPYPTGYVLGAGYCPTEGCPTLKGGAKDLLGSRDLGFVVLAFDRCLGDDDADECTDRAGWG